MTNTSEKEKQLQNRNQLLIEYDRICTDGHAPYIKVKKDGHDKKVRSVNDGIISLDHRDNHIRGIELTGGRAHWYPLFMILDFDTQNLKVPVETAVNGFIDHTGLKKDQYVLSGSTSYYEKKNCHLYIRPEYNNKPATFNQNYSRLKYYAMEYGAELYPQRYKKVIDPCSPYQPILDCNSFLPSETNWIKMIDQYKNIKPFDLSTIEQQGTFSLEYKSNKKTFKKGGYYPKTEYMQNLIKHGLQHLGTRHRSILNMACYYSVNENVLPEQARRLIKKWIKNKHNGMSKDINTGKITEDGIQYEVSRAVDWAYSHYMRNNIHPHRVHNIGYGIAQSHLDFIAEVFPGDLVNQKRLLKLLSFYNPRSHWEYVYIHFNEWFNIVGSNNYKKFQEMLLNKGIISCNNIYIPGVQSKGFKIEGIPQNKDYISFDNRNIVDYDQIMKMQSIDYLKNKLKWNRKAIYRLKSKKESTVKLDDIMPVYGTN
jgi:hypothetical protein